MRRQMLSHGPLYLVGLAAIVMMLLAFIGLFTDLMGVPELRMVVRVVLTGIVVIAVMLGYYHR